MSIEQQKSPTFQLRKICQKIQTNLNQRLGEFLASQAVKDYQFDESKNQSYPFFNKKNSSDPYVKSQSTFLQKLKDDLCRIITSSLPEVVSYEAKANDKIQDLQQELQQCKKQLKKQKQNYKESILEKDRLKLEILQFQHQNKQLAEDTEIWKEKYNEAIDLCEKYMKEIHKLEDQIMQQRQRAKREPIKGNNLNLTTALFQQSFSNTKKSKQLNFPLQIKQKLNEAEKVLTRSPRSNDPQLESSHFQLSSEIVGCQKELLEIQLRESEKQKAQILIELEEERAYTQKLQKEANNLQKLLDGQKKLNQKLDKQLYMLINTSKEMKIQLLQQKAKTKQLQEEIYELQQQASLHHKQTTELQTKITQLQIQQKKIPQLQDQIQQLRQKLSIAQKKYEELRKIKQQLQDKVEQFQTKLCEIQRKQSEDQINVQQFHRVLKSQNSTKIKQIQQMSTLIKQKYQQKLTIMEKQYREIKEKCKHLKQQNNRLYEGMNFQAKKELKIQEKYAKIKKSLEQIQEQNRVVKKDKELLQQKWKTQSLLCKELKRQLSSSQKSKQFCERKLKRLQITKLPSLVAELKLLKDESMMIKTSVNAYKQMMSKIGSKNDLELVQKVQCLIQALDQRQQTFKFQLIKKDQTIEKYKKENQLSQQQKYKILQRNTLLESKQHLLSQQISKKEQEISQLSQKLLNSQQSNKNLQKQLQNYKKIQQSSLEKIELLRTKQNQVEKFYDLVNELSKENQKLRQNLDRFILKQQQEKIQRQLQDKVISLNAMAQNDMSPYMIPRRLSKDKIPTRSKQALMNKNTQSHSCLHHRPPSNNKASIVTQIPKNPSMEKRSPQNFNKLSTSYQQTRPYNLPIHSRPIQFNSRKIVTSPFLQKYQTMNSLQENPNFYDEGQKMKYDFQNQRQRLQDIKNQYQKLMAQKFRDQFIQKSQLQRSGY